MDSQNHGIRAAQLPTDADIIIARHLITSEFTERRHIPGLVSSLTHAISASSSSHHYKRLLKFINLTARTDLIFIECLTQACQRTDLPPVAAEPTDDEPYFESR